MSKWFKLENDDSMDVWVPRANIVKVDVTHIDEEEDKEWFSVIVMNGNNDEEIYEMRGPRGLAAKMVEKLEELEISGFWNRPIHIQE